MYDLDVLLKSYFGFSSLVQLEEMCLCDTSVAEPVMKTLHLRLGGCWSYGSEIFSIFPVLHMLLTCMSLIDWSDLQMADLTLYRKEPLFNPTSHSPSYLILRGRSYEIFITS